LRASTLGEFGADAVWRRGNGKDTRGTAYVVYEDIYDAKAAADHLSGFNVNNRYLICLYYSPKVMSGKARARILKEGLLPSSKTSQQFSTTSAVEVLALGLPVSLMRHLLHPG
jgi:RNA recognition motif. (a.k.a. RRM, RBD, or RNP domain)